MNAREIKLHRRAQLFREPVADSILEAQIAQVPRGTIDPRAKLHLDSTRLSLHKERVEAWRRGEHIAPITIDMALTQKCSYSCTFCYAGLQQNPAEAVSWEVYDQFLEDCAEIGVKAISLVSDGESTENPNYVAFIVKAKSLGLDIALGTNGLKLRELDKLVGNLTYLRVNYNAADPDRCSKIMGTSRGNVLKVLENVKLALTERDRLKADCTIGLQQVLLPEYADQVIQLARLAVELGVDYLVVKHCSDDENGRLGVDYSWYRSPIAQRLFDAAERLSTEKTSIQVKRRKMQTGNNRAYSKCFGPPLMLQLSGSGIVAPCGSFFNPAYSQFHIGDLKTQRFKDIWLSDRYKQVMGHLGSDFDPRKACAALCLQDSVNIALFNLVEGGIDLPPAIDSIHDRNFL